MEKLNLFGSYFLFKVYWIAAFLTASSDSFEEVELFANAIAPPADVIASSSEDITASFEGATASFEKALGCILAIRRVYRRLVVTEGKKVISEPPTAVDQEHRA